MYGRNKKSDTEKRKHPISCRVTDQELMEIDSLRGGMSRGEFLRRAAMGAELPSPVPPVNKEAWLDLSKLAGNINQMQKQLNTYGALNNPNDLPEIIQNLRLALIGVKESVTPDKPQEAERPRTIQDRHYDLRRDGCSPDELEKQLSNELHQIISRIGLSESDFYGWQESVLYEFGGWCAWAIEALEEVEKDKRRAWDSECDMEYELRCESEEDTAWEGE